MKRLLFSIAFLTALTLSVPTASAAFNQGLYDAFQGCETADCVEATTFSSTETSSSTLCSDNWGCPSCQADITETRSVCIKIHYASGWCKCSSPQALSPGKDPVCNKGGSCRYKV